MLAPVMLPALTLAIASSVQDPGVLGVLHAPPVCIEVLLEREKDRGLLAVGYDMGSGSWYRFGDGRLTVFTRERGVLHGAPVIGGGLEPATNILPRDGFIEEMVLPYVYLASILANPACVRSAVRAEDGSVTLIVHAPGGNPAAAPGSDPDQTVQIEVEPPARVRRIEFLDIPGQRGALVFLGEIDGIPVHSPDYGTMFRRPQTWRLVSGTVKPPGSAQRPCFTPESVEAAMLPIRREHDERVRERRAKEAEAFPPPPPPGAAPVEGPVERTPGAAWGPALVVTGVITLLVGGYLWYRSRR
jgi:hypothetical protein